MLKKVISLALATVVASSLVVMPTHAASFSEDNWVQYERGFYTSTSDFKECFKEYADTSFDTNQLTAVKMVATSTKTLSDKDRNPVAYKYGQNVDDYGSHADDEAAYAHMRFNLASFSDEYRTGTNYLQLRIDKDGTGSSRDHYYFDTWAVDGKNVTSVYATQYSSANAYTTKDWFEVVHQGRAGNGPASSTTANSHETALTAGDYDKIDLIMEYNKQDGVTSYIFANGKFMGSYYDSGITDKHFHGIVFRITKGTSRKTRGNSDYVALKFDADRIGHREYYNTDDYMVTMEDVMQDAGLGGEIDSTMIYKTAPDALEWYMPGNNQSAYTYEKDYSERKRINANVTYSGTEATIEATNTATSYATAAKMLSGFYPINGKTGVSYESYHPRAKYIKLSFDQTISNEAMWLEYATKYSGSVQALQMWNNEGNLVVGIKGGSNVTCNGNGHKPKATMTGTNHIDWILEPVEIDEENGYMKQYVYVNGKLAGEGQFGNVHVVRVADIILSTKNAAGTVKIDNWSMTLYKDEVVLDENGNFVIPEPVEPVVIEEVDMGGYEGKAWDVVINEFDSEATYSAVFTDGEDSIDGEIGFENVETDGSIAFAVFLHTSRANVAFDIVAE